jgi:UDP-N-acetyl-D-mannosaminuronic acid transferase (WecB/TagA/CpsF family)
MQTTRKPKIKSTPKAQWLAKRPKASVAVVGAKASVAKAAVAVVGAQQQQLTIGAKASGPYGY